MKSEDEIQRAHDMLSGLFRSEEIEVKFQDSRTEACALAALDVLCWVLEHEHNKAFENNLLKIEALCFGQGIVFGKLGEPPPKIVTDI